MELEVAANLADQVKVPQDKFLTLADQVIGFANHSATEMKRDGVHLAFLYAAARYGVFVWRSTPVGKSGNDGEAFIKTMVKRYEEMLREQIKDSRLENRPVSP